MTVAVDLIAHALTVSFLASPALPWNPQDLHHWCVPVGRETERRLLADAVQTAMRGEAAVLQVVGDAGIGKTHLLDRLTDARAVPRGFRVLRTTAIQGEAELPYAGLHSLIGPVQHLLPRLPNDQHRALSVALGVSAGEAGGDLLLGAAFLQLLVARVRDILPSSGGRRRPAVAR